MTAPLVALVGVTGAGKTAAALCIARELPVEIVSMDSVQVYRGMDIGSAKPTMAEREQVPHHLVDLVDPDVQLTTADWLRAADRCIDAVRARGHIPLVVGGTGLYLRALRDGLAELPSADAALRSELEREEDARAGTLHERLERLDPASASRIQPRDRVRLVRALEVHATTGKPLSAWLAEHAATRVDRRLVHVVIEPERDAIDQTLAQRTQHMLDAGLVDEARALRDRFGAVRPLQAVGYKEALAHVDGALALAELPGVITQSTRQFARRQRTWWRKLVDARVVGSVEAAVQALRASLE